MRKLDVITTESFLIDAHQKILPEPLVYKLYQFLATSYHITDQQEFQHLILQPKKNGGISVFYGINDEITGFSRTCSQRMAIGRKQVMAYTVSMYLNPHYTVYPTTTSMGLTQAIQYKLDHPQEESIYLIFANSPTTYEFIYQLSDSIYPKPSQRVPDQILTTINFLKKQYGWISTGSHPMVINSPLVPIRSQTSDFILEESEINEFYITTNPDYMQGNSLLVYMPLQLMNIGYGLKHSNSISYKSYSGHQNNGHPLHRV